MKFIKNHLMFILPLLAILLGAEFFMVFERTTQLYEKGLKESYTMMVVSHKPVELSQLQELNRHIHSSEPIQRERIVSQIAKGLNRSSSKEILGALPYFYNVGLDSYMKTSALDDIKLDLESDPNIKMVETFGTNHDSSYRLFSFIKFILNLFILFMAVVSLFLIMKQMEVWKYTHEERMKVMEIFGAPLMLRLGVLFRVAIVDAIVAGVLMSLIFFYVKFQWAERSGIDIIMQNHEMLMEITDLGTLFISALLIVIVAVFSTAFTSKGVRE